MTARGIQLFPVGLHIDSQGKAKAWELAELQEMADAYNSVSGSKHDAPILIGHDGNTSYGWLERCYVEGQVLLGDYKEVDPEFAEGVNVGRHKKRSISIYPRDHPNNPTPGKLNIRHVAYVGVPAVKGMTDHKFNDSGEGFDTYEFMDALSFPTPMAAIAYLLESMRDRAIDIGGVDAANQDFPKEAIDAIRSAMAIRYITAEQFDSFAQQVLSSMQQLSMRLEDLKNEDDKENNPMAYQELGITSMTTSEEATLTAPGTGIDLTAQFSELQTQVAELKAQLIQTQASLSESRTEVASLQSENAQLAQDRERDRVTNFVESLVQQRKLLPSEVQTKIELALAMPNDVAINFSEGTGTISLTLRQRYLDELAAGKELWSAADMPTHPQDAPSDFADPMNMREESFDLASVRLDRQIRAKAREMGKDPENLSDYAEAMQALNITI